MGDRFQNPVLFADYSDPDVIRVDDRFYLTASSFNYVPGLPVLVSEDLVHWKLENYALERISEDPCRGIPHDNSTAVGERFEIPRHSEGVWAPAIRFHDGKFYIFYGMPDEGIYMVCTEDPLGKWAEPVCIYRAKGFIDPCPWWDEDGRAYVIHAYAKSRIGFKSRLGIFEITPDGQKALTEDRFIFEGNDPDLPAMTIEGPKVYRRNGWYYILSPAGGVRRGWQLALRSKDIYGPYECRIVMEQGDTLINGPHQGALVDSPDGREWFLHFQDRGLYGRICHVQPVVWENDWPVIGNDANHDGIGNPVYEYDLPVSGKSGGGLVSSDEFENNRPGLQWQWMGNLRESPYGETERENGLCLKALNLSAEEEPVLWHCSNVLTQKLIMPEFCMDIHADASKLEDGCRAGVIMMGGQYTALYVQREQGTCSVCLAESSGDDKTKTETVLASFEISPEDAADMTFRMVFVRSSKAEVSADGSIRMIHNRKDLYFESVDSEKPELRMFFRSGQGSFTDSGCRFVPSDHTWVGAKTGIFAVSRKGSTQGCAEFVSVNTAEL
ncbi:MAG: glycoside hydrolase 43 family protein [Solobacterium sp.]|nr:glycoside hydrolase 43 family protein [Solobacterium sp.]